MSESTFGPVGTLALVVAAWEVLRFVAVRQVRGRLRRGALRFVREHRVRLESARFIDRVWLREALLQDHEIDHAAARAVEERGETMVAVRERVDAYVREIAPAFSLTAYYRLGAVLARLSVDFCYELVFDRRGFEEARRRVPEGAITVYVMNHRSNADYIVLSYGLLRHLALSYAVGEWARVWPLDLLFRAFGSYFVRRGEKDPVYHKVLERYVQLLVGHGGVTGFFIEGRLSRDGRLGTPKAGLLDAIAGVRRAQPGRPIWFVPVGINFDRVLEDRNLVCEGEGGGPPSAWDKARSAARLVTRLPVLVAANSVRVAIRSHRKLGIAAVAVGAPVSLDELQGGVELALLPREERREPMNAVARALLARIASTVPVTPVPVFCAALLSAEDLARGAVVGRVRDLVAALREAGAPLALGRAIAPADAASGKGLDGLDRDLARLGEAELIVTLAGFALERRRLVAHAAGRFSVAPASLPILRYYAASIEQYGGGRSPVTSRGAPAL